MGWPIDWGSGVYPRQAKCAPPRSVPVSVPWQFAWLVWICVVHAHHAAVRAARRCADCVHTAERLRRIAIPFAIAGSCRAGRLHRPHGAHPPGPALSRFLRGGVVSDRWLFVGGGTGVVRRERSSRDEPSALVLWERTQVSVVASVCLCSCWLLVVVWVWGGRCGGCGGGEGGPVRPSLTEGLPPPALCKLFDV